VIEPTAEGLLLRERALGVTVEEVVAPTGADLADQSDVPAA
jgi:acetate CoA/acetoacetate CoA-transferase beta subunit